MRHLLTLLIASFLLVSNVDAQIATVPKQDGNKKGVVIELTNGDLLIATHAPFEVYKSTDAGSNWTRRYFNADNDVNRFARLNFVDSSGNIYFGNYIGGAVSYLIRSSDSGENWSTVMTSESSALWYTTETSSGTLYTGEYSVGLQDANELYGYNIWRSTNNGVTWAKWFTHSLAPNTLAGSWVNAIRHLHILADDSNNNLFVAFGESNSTGGGKTYRLNTDATLGTLLNSSGNGMISFIESDNGRLFFGTDNSPFSILELSPSSGSSLSTNIDLTARFGSTVEPVYDFVKGKDGVLYGITNGSGSKPAVLVASLDDGITWVVLKFTEDVGDSSFLTLNRDRVGSRIYIERSTYQNYSSIQDYTKSELKALYTSGGGISGTVTATMKSCCS